MAIYSTTIPAGNNGITPIPDGLQVGMFRVPGTYQIPTQPVPSPVAGPKGILPDVPTVHYPRRILQRFAPASNYDPNNAL